MRDEGRSLGAGLQERASIHHLKLPWSRAIVVSIKEKAGHDPVRKGSRRRKGVNR